jgi:hypothetical protein
MCLDVEAFRAYLRAGGRSPRAADRCVAKVAEFEDYLRLDRGGLGLDSAGLQDLGAFVAEVEGTPGASAKTHLWAIRYYYEYSASREMALVAGALRQERITRKPFALGAFQGADQEQVRTLAEAGVANVKQMLEAGRTATDRAELSRQTSLPPEVILEFVKLSDLARIPGVKGIRARLCHDAGVDTVECVAEWEPKALREVLVDFVARTGFEGTAPLPKEAEFTVMTAKRLPRVIEY